MRRCRFTALLVMTGLCSLFISSIRVAVGSGSESSSRMKCGAQIECLTPDGHPGRISRLPLQDPNATALIMEDDTVTCALREGETNFVIELPDLKIPDRFTFLNENGRAHGELKISVSNRRLAANSSQWKEVEGVIPFAHKHLFGVSVLGIQAKYVRLSFRVEKQSRDGSATDANPSVGLTDTASSKPAAVSFSMDSVEPTLQLCRASGRANDPARLDCVVSSVAPLRLASN
jgi:hypothetical protein